jgi:hypothetical protein
MKNLFITCFILLFASITYSQTIPSIDMPVHPRILLLKGQEEGIKQNIATNAVWKKVHQNILAECDKIITKPSLERIQIGRRLLDKSRECIRRVFYLSFAWRSVNSVNRGIVIVDQKYVMVRDEIVTTDKETTVRWTMVTPAEVNITGNGTAELTQKGKKLRLQVVEPTTISLTTWTTIPTHDYDALNPGTIKVGFEVKIPAKTKCALTVLLIPENTNVKANMSIPVLKDWTNK